jgi:hypothetical protein
VFMPLPDIRVFSKEQDITKKNIAYFSFYFHVLELYNTNLCIVCCVMHSKEISFICEHRRGQELPIHF